MSKLRPLNVPVPRLKEDLGLGDAVMKVTSALRVRPCSRCKRRAAVLNRLATLRALKR